MIITIKIVYQGNFLLARKNSEPVVVGGIYYSRGGGVYCSCRPKTSAA